MKPKRLTWSAPILFLGLVVPGHPSNACTVITVGKNASMDGSVITSHTVDSHRTGTDVRVIPPQRHKKGAMIQCTTREEDDTGPMQRYRRIPTGKIPQVSNTYGYLAPAYAPMNQHQVAIGESTFGGREELQSAKGILDCETTQALMLQRAETAREAVRIAGDLIEKYGWNDVGEALTVVDPNEAWMMEIIGPGKDKIGAIWAARRLEDDHITVNANAARIGEIFFSDKENYMASANVVSAAVQYGYWDEKSQKPFDFSAAYNPEGRVSFAASRRVWRVFDLLAPSLKLPADSNRFPFSIKPEKKVSVEKIMQIFRDTYEGTDYDMTAGFTVTDEKTGKTVKSPLANPFMPYDANKLFKINGGWGWRGERTIARWYTMYTVITQSRAWLPDPIGGVVWFSYDNNAMTTYVPLHIGITDLPKTYQTDGRTTGFSRESAWWAFNRVSTLASQRWGDMRNDVAMVRDPLQKEYLESLQPVDKQALELYRTDIKKAREFLTSEADKRCNRVVQAYWDLGDSLWNKYDEQW